MTTPTDRETLIRLMLDLYGASTEVVTVDRILSAGFSRSSRAWEMGRDAALDQLTPPATLARPEPNETQRGPAGNDPDRPGGGSTSSGERRAPVSPRPEITDAMVERAAKAMWNRADDEIGWETTKKTGEMADAVEWCRGDARAALESAFEGDR